MEVGTIIKINIEKLRKSMSLSHNIKRFFNLNDMFALEEVKSECDGVKFWFIIKKVDKKQQIN